MLNVRVSGHGMAVVLLHGFCENLSLWNGLRISLDDKYQIITYDLPGFGKSDNQLEEFTLTDVAELLHDNLQNILGINKYVVLGHSLGGYIGLSLADKYPESILGFGLINSTSFADDEAKKKIRDKTIMFIKSQGVSAFLENFVNNLFTIESQNILKDKITEVLEMGSNLTVATLTSYIIAMRKRPDNSFLLNKIRNILLVEGLQDVHISYSDIEKQVKLIDNSRNCYLFNNVAHMSMYEEPELLNSAINDYLATIKND